MTTNEKEHDMFNLQLAVEELADITKPPVDYITHDQGSWGSLDTDDASALVEEEDGNGYTHLVIDPVTKLPVGAGSCTSAFCFAGGVVVRSGIPLHWTKIDGDVGEWGHYEAGYVQNPDGTKGDRVSAVAADLLGISENTYLFESSNDLEDLHEIVAECAGLDTAGVYELVAGELAKRGAPVG